MQKRKPIPAHASGMFPLLPPGAEEKLLGKGIDAAAFAALLNREEEMLFMLLRERVERAARENDQEFFAKLDQLVRDVLRTVNPAIENTEQSLDIEKAASHFDIKNQHES